MPREPREKLDGLLDYVQQVIRLDERVVFQLSEYRLPDKTSFAINAAETRNLPGVRHDVREDGEAVWLEVERLARKQPPEPPIEISDWLEISADPSKVPEVRAERLITVSARERDAMVATGEARQEDTLPAPTDDQSPEPSVRYDLILRLEDRPEIRSALDAWIAGPWATWAAEEIPRRNTITLYQQLYKVFQTLQAAESAIEVSWGIGVVHWEKEGRIIDRPLLEVRVDLELDDSKAGLIRVRPTSANPVFDLKPYEELGCVGIPQLADLIRQEIRRANENSGLSPFVRESFETILLASASRLDSEGWFASDVAHSKDSEQHSDPTRLVIYDDWVLFARPRSQHVVLQDIHRLREAAKDSNTPIKGLAERLVTEPSAVSPGGDWAPLGNQIGTSPNNGRGSQPTPPAFDLFFPKPFNDEQSEIVRRIEVSDGLVVQGPPGTGKTHTIANLICHAIATGKRVLVTSHGEAALAVLKDQLPEEVQPLAIAILSNERQGLRQIESAIREIQSVVEGTTREQRLDAIRRMETDIEELEARLVQIDLDLDGIAAAHFNKIGPRGETPAQLAQRLVSEREAFRWFVDRPSRFTSETELSEADIAAIRTSRRRVGKLIDHLGAVVPSPADLPTPENIRMWHEDLVRADDLLKRAKSGPIPSISLNPGDLDEAAAVAGALEALAETHPTSRGAAWLEPLRRAIIKGDETGWVSVLRDRLNEWTELDSQRLEFAQRLVELPQGLIGNQDAREAVSRAASGERLWPILTIGKGEAKSLVSTIRLDGVPVQEGDTEGWLHIASFISYMLRRQQITARWHAFVAEAGVPRTNKPLTALDTARRVVAVADGARILRNRLSAIASNAVTLDQLLDDPHRCRSLAQQIRAASSALRLSRARQHVRRTAELFEHGSDPTSKLTRQFVAQAVGRREWTSDKIEDAWRHVLKRAGMLRGLAGDFETIRTKADLIAQAGAPHWAKRLQTEQATSDDPLLRADWRDAWDHAAADAKLAALDAGNKLSVLAQEREDADRRRRKLFAQLVRERTFYELDRRLSPMVKAALVQFVVALTHIGKGTGKGASVHRGAAREALARCYDAVPCWIMPTWRVAEQLPPELGVVDLVIVDEASQSDVTELPALLRGRKILVVGDDRQVSPTAPFVTQDKIIQLRHHYLGDLPFKNLLEPGESIYHLMRAVFPDERLMLKEHFRCVEPIVRFSMQFYPERLVPLRIPTAQERLDPPLIDIYLPHGRRDGRRKINRAEADVIVSEIEALTNNPIMKDRSIGVISLIGSEQAEHVRAKLSEQIGEELMQRHRILCGDSAAFQGTERDIVFLSMVADPVHRTALTMNRFEQRFNVAVSRARDRLVLVRSVKREELNENDLKARLIAHFENPMPPEPNTNAAEECESKFERDMMQVLLDRGYRVRSQVGSVGFRIDLVVEGNSGRRLAIECDGDRFHGSEQWRDDMRRQRVLERVGWRFWRCFASSFYHDHDRTVGDLLETLSRMGIEPIPNGEEASESTRYTDHRIFDGSTREDDATSEVRSPLTSSPLATSERKDQEPADHRIAVGDQIALRFASDRRQMIVRLTEGTHDLDAGMISRTSELGMAIRNAEEGEEVEFAKSGGKPDRVLIEKVNKSAARHPTTREVEAPVRGTTASLSMEARRVDAVRRTVIQSGTFDWGSVRVFSDGSIETEIAGAKQWYRNFDELERARRSSMGTKNLKSKTFEQAEQASTTFASSEHSPLTH